MPIYHKHHIIPKHMGGTNDPSNLVVVTVEEHAALHKQLWKDLGHEEDRIAWLCLSGQITNAEATILAIKNAQTGRKHSEETKRKISQNNPRPNKGKKFSEEIKQKMRKPKKIKKSDDLKKQISDSYTGRGNPFFGKKHTDESKEKIREARSKQIITEETKKKISEKKKEYWKNKNA